MDYIRRNLHGMLSNHLSRGKSILLLGPRQVGKTTLLSQRSFDRKISLIRPSVRQRYERNPELFLDEMQLLSDGWKEKRRPVVVVDEVQKVPELMDVFQEVIDEGLAQLVLTGSSARKLRRRSEVNLLPGRVVKLQLDPLDLSEHGPRKLEDLLYYGSLPGILLTEKRRDREADLQTYVETYLEDEVRAEALVRQIGTFSRFLELAALEAGRIVNLSELGSEVGANRNTVSAYYQILVDCLLAERIEPITHSATRKRLVRSSRFLFFDLGVRRLCAREGDRLGSSRLGELFEQYVGIEILRLSRFRRPGAKLRYWRDANGPEVDWVLEHHKELIPFEVKWAKAPPKRAARHLRQFLDEYPEAKKGYVVCQTPRPYILDREIAAIPWQMLPKILEAPFRAKN